MAVAENIPHSSHLPRLEYLTNMQTHGRKMGISRIFSERFYFNKTVFCKEIYPDSNLRIATIGFSQNEDFLACGHLDRNSKKTVVVWNMSKVLSNAEDRPAVIKCEDNFEVHCLAFHKSHKILTASTFSTNKNIILYDINTRKELLKLEVEDNVTGLSWDPMNDNIFASSSRKCFLWDLRQRSIGPLTLAAGIDGFPSIKHHPVKTELLAAANISGGVYLLDVRNPETYLNKLESPLNTTCASFDTTGRHLLAIRNRLSVYDTNSFREIAKLYYPDYPNAMSSNTGCFAGGDRFVLSGSVYRKIYAWQIPINNENESLHINYPHFVLKGHRYLANKITYNNTYGVIASCGYGNNIKLWSLSQLPFFKEQSNQLTEE